jgi:folate-binding protein YgfZ
MGSGYEALRHGTAWLDFSARGRIIMLGEDRVRLLHALVTNHIEQLTPGKGCYAFFLNAQGRILGDVNVFCREDRLLLDLEPDARERLYQHLDKYIIADDVILEDASESMTAVGLEGPRSAEVLNNLGAPALAEDFANAGWQDRIVARVSFTGEPGFRIFAPAGGQEALIRELEANGAVRASSEEARIVRLEHGKPRYGEDFSDKTLAQETQQTHAMHFSKGCYLGQEIVERVRSRGQVHRVLVPVEIEGEEQPTGGLRFSVNGADGGWITSSAYSPALGRTVALAYVPIAHSRPGTVFDLAGHPAVVAPSDRS